MNNLTLKLDDEQQRGLEKIFEAPTGEIILTY